MKIYKRIFLLLILFVGFSAYGQENINTILTSIDENNPTIAALRAHFDYVKADARAELLPPNPSIEGGRFPAVQGAGIKYAWGVSQSFEFPTVYAKRGQLAKTTDRFADVSFNAARQAVLLDAKLTLLELVHSNRMLSVKQERKEFVQNIERLISKMVDAGEVSSMDLNNAKLRVAEANQALMIAESEIDQIKRRLSALNGNKKIADVGATQASNLLPEMNALYANFEQNDPRFVALQLMVDQADAHKKLVKHQGLPELSIGYESEQTDAEHFTGFRAGLTIPLWGNTNKRKAANIQLNATRLEHGSQKLQLKAEFEEFYIKALNTKARLDELNRALSEYNNINLLQRALEAGQISVIELFNEITFLYDLTDKVLELELEYAKLYAELYRFEL
jgi:cobalt-zinc-cadmium efflux system outer membrane protein